MYLPHTPKECCPHDEAYVAGVTTLAPKPFLKAAESATRRFRLIDLNAHFHCSVVGTCLTTSELRRLVPRFKQIDRSASSDAEIHHAAVELAGEEGAGSKALNKALDDRYELTLRRYRQFKCEKDLVQGWDESTAQGDIPGAYWASLTHPCASTDFRRRIFGEVHMLSHLVGAANRADIRRLVQLEADNAQLKEQLEALQLDVYSARLGQQDAKKEQQRLSAVLDAKDAKTDTATVKRDELLGEIEQLKSLIVQKEAALNHQATRRESAESRIADLNDELLKASQRIESAQGSIDALKSELQAQHIDPEDDFPAEQRRVLEGRRILYVGGRPSAVNSIRSVVERSGGEFLVHGGGSENRRGLLGSLVSAADLVVFPVDCIDHDSVGTLKRECERNRIAYHPLRTSSAAAFIALLARLAKTPEVQFSSV